MRLANAMVAEEEEPGHPNEGDAGDDENESAAKQEDGAAKGEGGEDEGAGQDGDGEAGVKKKKPKQGKAASNNPGAAAGQEDDGDAPEGDGLLSSQDQLLSLIRRTRLCEESRRQVERPHLFWDTQPVPAMVSEDFQDSGPIDEPKTVDEVRAEPYNLPEAFEWCTCDVDNDAEATEIYTLLSENYVEDDDSMFRFDYSVNFLRWALTPPGYLQQWHVGVRVQKTHKLVGFITGIPANIQVYDTCVKMAEINFLCVHKKLRSKRLAPVLIKEITRRVNRMNIWQAVYTAGVVLPRPVSECRYWHRSLNPKKLIEVGFSHLGPRMTMARTIKLYKLPEAPQLAGVRLMRPSDQTRVFEIVSNYLKKFHLHPEFTAEELGHWMLPREGVVYAYVRELKDQGVTDVCSFYSLPSSILGNDKHTLLKAAYSYWNVATTVPLHDLMYNALILAKQRGFDVFNALNVMENEQFLRELKFGIGDGFLQYYLYNWKCPKIQPNGIGLVLL